MDITIQDLKNKYSFFQKKYGLSSFERLNEDFYLDVRVVVDSEYILREIGGVVRRKIGDALNYVESFFNPQNLPR